MSQLDPRGVDYMTFCHNGDGTYSAVKAAIWLVHMSSGKVMTLAAAQQLVDEAFAKRKMVDSAPQQASLNPDRWPNP